MNDEFVADDNNQLLLETMSSLNFVDQSAQMMAQFSDSDFIDAAGPFGGDDAAKFLSSASNFKA
jgi:hypothetical protein